MEGRDSWGVWVGMCTLLCLKMKNQHGPTYSTGDSAHVRWQPELEGSLEKMDACVCVAESLNCSPATMTWFVNWLYPDTK